MSDSMTRLTLRVDEVKPMDCVDMTRGRFVRTRSCGVYDFGTWPNQHRAQGVELEVGHLSMETTTVFVDSDVYPVHRTVWDDLEVTRYRSDTVVQVVRGLGPMSLSEPTPAEVAAAAAAQEAMEAALEGRR